MAPVQTRGSQFCSDWWKIGALRGIRTPDPQIRSLVLYPAELAARDEMTYRRAASLSIGPGARARSGAPIRRPIRRL